MVKAAPLDTERALVASIVHGEKERARELLNQLLGFILFSTGGGIAQIKMRTYELLVVMTRAAIDAGANPEQAYRRNQDFILRCGELTSVDELCRAIGEVMNQTVDSVFQYADIKHKDVIHRAVSHVQVNYGRRITLEEAAGLAYLSPSYFSKVFKQEMGCSFGSYRNRVRIQKSRELLAQNLKLVEVAALVGFEDQSYFTKMFKRVVGMSPNRYRTQGGR